ncbi:YegP family protein [Paraconexibacter antarcticus]|uniref:YegP family protein n=1 Tax=Paraconexibacter antarcticus TaxID=2949664 RepID=A0ABY5DR38_9ACTN|nr:YegP family protein [Paraconexibacter antarcticus]UTI63374.1 YegP family protein [Paraconexibacter antarcticus]
MPTLAFGSLRHTAGGTLQLVLHPCRELRHNARPFSPSGSVNTTVEPVSRHLGREGNAKAAATNFKAGAKTWNYDVYENAGGKYSWRAKARNGQNVGSAGESFASKTNAQRAADNVRDNAGTATGP